MSSNKRLIVKVALSALFAVALIMIAPYAVLIPGITPENLHFLFNQHAETLVNGVLAAEYSSLAEGIGKYLAEETDEAQIHINRYGTRMPAFSDKEIAHLADVKALIIIAKNMFFAGFVLMLTNVLMCFWYSAKVVQNALHIVIKVALHGIILFFAFAGIIVLLVATDFHSAFYVMHQILFINNLWLMDPSKDLMIQLMPEQFFIEFANQAVTRLGLGTFTIMFIIAISYLQIRRREYKQ